jgi:hypothetical protein
MGESFEYAKKLFTDLGRLVMLVILSIIPVLNLIVIGYQTRVVKGTPSSSEPPPLVGYGELFIQGLKVAIAAFLYMLVPMILMLLGGFSLIFHMAGARFRFPTAMGIGFLALGALLAFCMGIVAAMAIVHMVKNDDFGKAFAVGEILQIIGNIGWGKYVIWLVVTFVICMVVGSLGSIPFMGWILSAIVSPVLGVFVMRSAALIYSEGTTTTGASPVLSRAEVPPSMKFCPNCGTRMTADSAFCPNCGRKQ